MLYGTSACRSLVALLIASIAFVADLPLNKWRKGVMSYGEIAVFFTFGEGVMSYENDHR